MASHAWRRIRVLFSVLIAALAGGFVYASGQAGLAYGLTVLRWGQSFDAGRQNLWSAQLTWVAWIAASSAALGAIAAVRAPRRSAPAPGPASRIGAAFAATLGAAVTAALVLLPARAAHPPGAIDPGLTAAVAAGAGAIAGLVVALAAATVPPAAGNVVVTAVAVWALVLLRLTSGAEPGEVRVGVAGNLPHLFGRPWEMPLIAVVAAALVAGYARWVGVNRVGIAISGAAGPALFAAAYLIGGPGANRALHDQDHPHQAALIAVVAGLLVSVTAAAVGRRSPAVPVAPTTREQPPAADTEDLTVATPAAAPPAPATAPPPTAPPAPAAGAHPEPRSQPVADRAAGAGDDYADWVRGLGSGRPDPRGGTVYGG
jgi:hypothetical protein